MLHGYLQTIDIAPKYRRRGVASRILEHVEDQIAQAGGLAMRLHVSVQNQPAIMMYEHHGYSRLAGYAISAITFVFAITLLIARGMNPTHLTFTLFSYLTAFGTTLIALSGRMIFAEYKLLHPKRHLASTRLSRAPSKDRHESRRSRTLITDREIAFVQYESFSRSQTRVTCF